MTIISTDLRQTRESAKRIRYEPTLPLTATNVQDAVSQVQGEVVLTPTSVTFAMSPYTVLPTDRVILVNTSGGATSIILPAAASRNGLDIEVKDITGNAAANNISVSFPGTMDGLASPVVINNPYGYFRFNPIAAGNYYET